MSNERVEVAQEVVPGKAFVWAIDWPGWCRSGKDPALAVEAFVAVTARYALVARGAGLAVPVVATPDVDVVESLEGAGGTSFGVPSLIVATDRRPTTTAEAERLASLVVAAWRRFDEVAAGAPAELRKGPRGGGRDRDKMIGHVIEAGHAYAREIGIRLPPPDPTDRAAVNAEHEAVLEALRRASHGSPLADRRWTQRYAARRIAWHVLDHSWEMEDRTERGQ